MNSIKSALIILIQKFPKGSIWQTRYICLPLIIIITTLTLSHSSLGYGERAMWFVLGLLSWTFLEYVFHRWILHWHPHTDVDRALVERLHIFHHEDPSDESQVCIPVLLGVMGWTMIYLLILCLGANPSGGLLVICGIFLMMTIYDITHFSAHYMNPTNLYLRILKKHHMLHHFSDHTKRFGVTSPIWDYVFNTH